MKLEEKYIFSFRPWSLSFNCKTHILFPRMFFAFRIWLSSWLKLVEITWFSCLCFWAGGFLLLFKLLVLFIEISRSLLNSLLKKHALPCWVNSSMVCYVKNYLSSILFFVTCQVILIENTGKGGHSSNHPSHMHPRINWKKNIYSNLKASMFSATWMENLCCNSQRTAFSNLSAFTSTILLTITRRRMCSNILHRLILMYEKCSSQLCACNQKVLDWIKYLAFWLFD